MQSVGSKLDMEEREAAVCGAKSGGVVHMQF